MCFKTGLPTSKSFCNAWRKRASTPWLLRRGTFPLISWVHPSSHRWQAGPILSGACWDNTALLHCPSRRVSPLRCSIESAMPRLVMVRAWWGPFRQSFLSGSCSSAGLFPSRRCFGSLRRTRQQQNTAFRRRTSDRFQNRNILRRIPMRYPASTCAVALATGLLATSAIAQVVDFGKYPDFRGQWDRTGPPNNWRPLAGPPPLTPEYQKILDQSIAEQRAG